ncbi:hypothetical protein CPB83DRAFT_853419 [Crepidotus variabilis]|uniref:Uncharacterized protein n=1 Tax=Crepidotus variabilis TaxID=179855 RepID=A0A9P6EH26_9AGAR|nr:hypothetical protein CPB83DRAFT_853419 [Crepidotus variabilis]
MELFSVMRVRIAFRYSQTNMQRMPTQKSFSKASLLNVRSSSRRLRSPSMFDSLLTVIALVTAASLLVLSLSNGQSKELKHVPTTGYTLPILSLFYLLNTREILEESISKWPTSIFKIPTSWNGL